MGLPFSADIFDSGYKKILNYMPARKYLFDVVLPDMSGKLLAAESGSFPFVGLETLNYTEINKDIHFAGKMDVPQMSIDFYENELGLVTDYFTTWMRAKSPKDVSSVVDPLGYIQYSENYKRDIYALFRSSQGWPYMALFYKGCFPVSLSPLTVDMTSSEVVTISVTFSVDDIDIMGISDALNML